MLRLETSSLEMLRLAEWNDPSRQPHSEILSVRLQHLDAIMSTGPSRL